MGYSTDFFGVINVVPPLTADVVAEILAFSEERHGGDSKPDPPFPGFWCNFEAVEDGSGIRWNGDEKTYDAEWWVQHIIDRWVKPTARVANGELRAEGEESGDIWKLVVRDNEVTVARGRVVFDEA